MRTTALRHLAYSTALVIFSLTLSACGGSSSDPDPDSSSVAQSSSSSAPSSSQDDSSSSSSDSSVSSSSSSADATPDAFDFPNRDGQMPGSEVTSEPVTITGINVPAEITVENGHYAIDEGEFTDQAGQIENNQSVTVKTTAPAGVDDHLVVTVTIGGVNGEFTVSTPPDTEPPEAAFVFPTPMTATEADTVIVRGTAEDELSTVTRITLQVTNEGGTTDLNLESENDFATWQKEVPLTEGNNTITITAEDELGNELTDGGSVTVVRHDLEESFPDAELPIENPKKLVYDEERERVLFGAVSDTTIFSVDINTGKRSAFLNRDMVPDLSDIDWAQGLEIMPGGDQLLVLLSHLNGEGPGVLRVDLDTKEYEVLLTRDSQPDDQPNITSPTSIRLDPDNSDRAIMLDSSLDAMISLDLTTGVRTLISNNDGDFSGPRMRTPSDLLIDAENNRAVVAEDDFSSSGESLYWVNLETGNRDLLPHGVPGGMSGTRVSSIVTDDIGDRVIGVETVSDSLWSVDTVTGEYEVISGPEHPHGYNEISDFKGIALSSNNEFLIGVDIILNGLFVIDLKTGERVILSKN